MSWQALVSPHVPLRNGEFRLLMLYPGEQSDPLRCSFHTAPIGDPPEYTALSYVWGTSENQSPIVVDNNKFQIGENLHAALRELRSPVDSKLVWADALCINQADGEEKGVCVQMMGDIYKNATVTVIWLGEGDENSDIAMDFVSQIDIIEKQDWSEQSFLEDIGRWKALKDIMERPWWSRTWTIQEAFLSPRPVVRCGKKELLMESFIRMYHAFREHFWTDTTRFAFGRPFEHTPFSTHMNSWAEIRNSVKTNQGDTLLEWLITAPRHKAGLPRDKIYAFLGMCRTEDRAAIKPSYERVQDASYSDTDQLPPFRKSDRQVFAEVTAHCIRQRGDLLALQVAQEEKRLDLPTWVGDYSFNTSRFLNITARGEPDIRPDGGAEGKAWIALGGAQRKDDNSHIMRVSSDLETIILTGIAFDTIIYASETPWTDVYQGPDPEGSQTSRDKRIREARMAFRQWKQEVDKLSVAKSPYKNTPGGIYEAFWRTLMLDQYANFTGPPDANVSASFEEWTATEQDTQEYKDSRFYQSAVPRAQKRSFIITKKGYIGMALKRAEIDDIVTILRGGIAAFVLRSKGKGYAFMGEAYVHGLMKGEVFKDATPTDVVEFTIR